MVDMTETKKPTKSASDIEAEKSAKRKRPVKTKKSTPVAVIVTVPDPDTEPTDAVPNPVKQIVHPDVRHAGVCADGTLVIHDDDDPEFDEDDGWLVAADNEVAEYEHGDWVGYAPAVNPLSRYVPQ